MHQSYEPYKFYVSSDVTFRQREEQKLLRNELKRSSVVAKVIQPANFEDRLILIFLVL